MDIRIGIVDFDSSHCVEFTRRLNKLHPDPDQCVDGARVVMGCPGDSLLSPERIAGFTEQMQRYGVPLVTEPAEMIGQVDAVMVLSVDGTRHLERTRPFLDASIPCFVDKPFTCALDEARELADLSVTAAVPIWSASALRFVPEVVDLVQSGRELIGLSVFGPSPCRSRNPGMFHYGIHPVEILLTLMGPRWLKLTCFRSEPEDESGWDSVLVEWQDGRVATVRGIRSGCRGYGFTAFCADEIVHTRVPEQYMYRELLKQIVSFFQTKTVPVPLETTLNLIGFLEAALLSGRNGGDVIENPVSG